MPNHTFYRLLGIGAASLAAAGGLMTSTASAATPVTYLTMVGSNTTQEVMGAAAASFNKAHTGVQVTNVYAQPADPGTTAPSDANCNGGTAITYISEANPGPNQATAPNGSGAGRTALANSVTNGDSCISIARSSSPGASTDPTGTQAYAYAVDAVTWSALPQVKGGEAPVNLTMTQLEGVYDCQYTNWQQVGGKAGPIVRYYPQNGSGSGSFFAGVLGFDPRVLGGVNTCTTPAIPIEENEATQVAKADARHAVMIFSGGGWIAQANGVDTDLRGGFVTKQINGFGAVQLGKNGKYMPAPPVTEKNVEPPAYMPSNDTAVQGVRNLFNFINTGSVDYAAAVKFTGPGSALCTGKDSSIVAEYGFKSLPKCVEQF